jgi:general secretion pathway protein M
MTRARAVALALLLALVALVWIGPVAAYLDLVGTDAQHLSAATAALARSRALVDAAPRAKATIDTALLLPDISDAQAIALLQESLKGAAATAQVEIQGLQVLQADTLGGAPRVGVRLRARGQIAGLDRLLYAIEASRPLLYPDNLEIQAHRGDSGAKAGALDFQLDVSAFRAGAPS